MPGKEGEVTGPALQGTQGQLSRDLWIQKGRGKMRECQSSPVSRKQQGARSGKSEWAWNKLRLHGEAPSWIGLADHWDPVDVAKQKRDRMESEIWKVSFSKSQGCPRRNPLCDASKSCPGPEQLPRGMEALSTSLSPQSWPCLWVTHATHLFLHPEGSDSLQSL